MYMSVAKHRNKLSHFICIVCTKPHSLHIKQRHSNGLSTPLTTTVVTQESYATLIPRNRCHQHLANNHINYPTLLPNNCGTPLCGVLLLKGFQQCSQLGQKNIRVLWLDQLSLGTGHCLPNLTVNKYLALKTETTNMCSSWEYSKLKYSKLKASSISMQHCWQEGLVRRAPHTPGIKCWRKHYT